ncbi:hypothetical protein, conserved [Eimeria necatrix]|uniref:Uncharacterized protein n=1 Tax=Eimeria necatrix TaxID=51315 RepID=U6N5J5_9EIME|nr:hypothetical protein, conserved [Eimeria necatrix]CDJ69995.1 hypothetical protein, conserved [Eimeria necatrix]
MKEKTTAETPTQSQTLTATMITTTGSSLTATGADRTSSYPFSAPRLYSRVGDRYSRLDGVSSEDSPRISVIRSAMRGPSAKYRKSISASWGLGEGVSGRMTAALLVGMLLFSMSVPIAVIKLQGIRDEEQQRQQQQHALLPSDSGLRDPARTSERTSTAEYAAGEADLTRERLPLTPNLHQSFLSLKHTGDHGLLLTVKDPEWAKVREALLQSIESLRTQQAIEFEGTEKTEETLRLMLAMDLACLENTAVETKLAVDDARASHLGGFSEALAAEIRANMDARRRQARAAELWEAEVQKGKLGSDPALKSALLKLLLAVRSRAAASEYLSAAVGAVLLGTNPTPRDSAEENRVYEGLAYLIKAGQLAATNSLIETQVSPWLAIIFTSL